MESLFDPRYIDNETKVYEDSDSENDYKHGQNEDKRLKMR